jgi:type IV pilus assembly protein PilV
MSIRSQQGSFLLEALVGTVIFAIGAMGMILLQASSIAIQNDSQYRIEADNLAGRVLGEINITSRTNTGAVNAATLATFSHQPTGGVTTCRLASTDPAANNDCCNFTGLASTDSVVTNWVAAVSTAAATRLPGSTSARQQIVVNAANNQVAVTICWQGPKDARPRFHSIIGYVN